MAVDPAGLLMASASWAGCLGGGAFLGPTALLTLGANLRLATPREAVQGGCGCLLPPLRDHWEDAPLAGADHARGGVAVGLPERGARPNQCPDLESRSAWT